MRQSSNKNDSAVVNIPESPLREPPPLLVDYGLLKDSPIPADQYDVLIFNLRWRIETILGTLYQYDAHFFSGEIITLIGFINHMNKGAYSTQELNTVLHDFSPPTSQMRVTSEEEALPEHKHSFGVKRKLNTLIQFRSLSSRLVEAIFMLIAAFPQESFEKIHKDTHVIQNTLRALSSLLAFIRAVITLSSALKYAFGYKNTEHEKKFSFTTRLLEQLKRNIPLLTRDTAWTIVRFIGWEDTRLQKYLMEMTLGLFSFVLLQNLVITTFDYRFYNMCIAHRQTLPANENTLHSIEALKNAQRKTLMQNFIQITIWFFYVVGALLCALGKECDNLSNQLKLIFGSLIIAITCCIQIWIDRHKPRLHLKSESKTEDTILPRTPRSPTLFSPINVSSSGVNYLPTGLPDIERKGILNANFST